MEKANLKKKRELLQKVNKHRSKLKLISIDITFDKLINAYIYI